jgi:hypothetical protein
MSINNKLFQAFTSVIQSEDEIKELKQHINTINADFFGNGLNASKNDVYLSKLFGFNNANTMSNSITKKISSSEELIKYIYKNKETLFNEISSPFDEVFVDYITSLNVPILKIQAKDFESSVKRTFEITIIVTFSKVESQLNMTHELYVYDLDEDELYEMPQNWDLKRANLTYIIEEYFEFGKVIYKEITVEGFHVFDEALRYRFDSNTEDFILVNALSSGINTFIVDKLYPITKIKSVTKAIPKTESSDVLSNNYYYSF